MSEGRQPGKDTVFGELALERGHIRHEQLVEAIEDQEILKTRGLRQSLAQILVSKGLIGKEQFRELRREASVRTGEASYVGEYEVLSELGRGGMGIVYKARHRETGEIVALKVLPKQAANEALIARFSREAAIVAGLDHPNLVRFRALGIDERRRCHYCALEFVDGIDLGKALRERGAFSEEEAARVAWQVAQALAHAHGNGLVHRDIKPENIMVTPDGAVKLLDLGLARPTDTDATRHTQTGVFVGSPYYASPEQIRAGKTVDGRSDIYSLGASLYHMVTGRVPFSGNTSIEVFHKHLQDTPTPPCQIRPELSHEISKIIARAMAKKREDRYRTIEDMARALESLPYEVRPGLAGTRSIYGRDFVGPAPAREEVKSVTQIRQWQELKEREEIAKLSRKPADYTVRCFGCGECVDIRATVPVKTDGAGTGHELTLLCEACMAELPASATCEMCDRNFDLRLLVESNAVDTWVCPWCYPWQLSQQALAGELLRRGGVEGDVHSSGDAPDEGRADR
jgi:serine/threonine-protein kinase